MFGPNRNSRCVSPKVILTGRCNGRGTPTIRPSGVESRVCPIGSSVFEASEVVVEAVDHSVVSGDFGGPVTLVGFVS